MAEQQFDQTHSPLGGGNLTPETPPSGTERMSYNPYSPVALPDEVEKPRGKQWGWSLIWMLLLLVFGGTSVGALLWLVTTPPPPNCQQVSPLAADGERLYCARKAAESGDLDQLLAAIALAQTWTPDHPMHSQAQQMVGEWSKAILNLAIQKVEMGDLPGAMKMIEKIPDDSPTYFLVTEEVNKWRYHWDDGQVLYDQAQIALKNQNWRQASDYAQALSKLDNVFWQQRRYRELLEQIALERQGWQRFNEAQRLAKRGNPEQLAEGIKLALKISPQLYVRQQADQSIANWSQELLKIASQRLDKADLPGALSIAELIPPQTQAYAEAQDLIQLGRAQAVIGNQGLGMPKLSHIFTLLDGRGAAAQITPDRPLYAAATAQVQTVDEQIEDLVQLQLAGFLASFDHPWTLQLAADQATMVAPNRPRRIHAQTLVAHWRQEIQRQQDRPFLRVAQALAEQKTVAAYQAAIQQARQVALGRPLRVEAQTLIAHWTKQTQVIEDQPLLDQAEKLAKEGKLREAAEVAAKIQPGRALYEQAKSKGEAWLSEIQIAEDRPVLTQASALASQGRLTAAIDTASQIGYGRALYNEAQNSIARWSAERNAIWSSRQAEIAPAPAAVSSYEPAPSRQEAYYEPAPAPAPEYYEPAPAPEYYEPALAPAPEPEYYEPEPVVAEPAAFPEPAPEPFIPEPPEPMAPVIDNNLLQE